jgi:hypothetical protein
LERDRLGCMGVSAAVLLTTSDFDAERVLRPRVGFGSASADADADNPSQQSNHGVRPAFRLPQPNRCRSSSTVPLGRCGRASRRWRDRKRKSGSHVTRRWRKPDSNHRSRLMCCALIQFGIGGRQISTVNASIATSIGPRQLRVEQIEAEPHGRETECRREMAPPPTRRPGLGAAHRGPSTYPAMK